MVFREGAGLDLRNNPDGPDCMLIHHIDMIHVMLHLGDDASEIGNEAAKNASLIQSSQGRFRVLTACHHFKEKLICLQVAAKASVDQSQILPDQPQRVRMYVQTLFLSQMEHFQHLDRIFFEIVIIAYIDAAAFNNISLQLSFPETQAWNWQAAHLLLLGFKAGAENPGQITDILGDKEIMLHEPFDAFGSRMIFILQAFRELRLNIEGDSLFGAARQVMQMTTDRAEKVGRLREFSPLLFRENPKLDQFRDIRRAMQEFCDPEQGLQVTEAALAFLYVRLHHIARVAEPFVALLALFKLGINEITAMSGNDLLHIFAIHLLEHFLIAPKISGFQNRGLNGGVLFCEADTFINVASRMTNFQPKIPEHIEYEFDHLFTPGGLLIGKEEQEVDI